MHCPQYPSNSADCVCMCIFGSDLQEGQGFPALGPGADGGQGARQRGRDGHRYRLDILAQGTHLKPCCTQFLMINKYAVSDIRTQGHGRALRPEAAPRAPRAPLFGRRAGARPPLGHPVPGPVRGHGRGGAAVLGGDAEGLTVDQVPGRQTQEVICRHRSDFLIFASSFSLMLCSGASWSAFRW